MRERSCSYITYPVLRHTVRRNWVTLPMQRESEAKAGSLKDLISQAEAARIRGVTRAAIRDLISRGRLVPVEIAGRLFVSRAEVESFEKRTPGPKPDASD
jgi:hypothetical protein